MRSRAPCPVAGVRSARAARRGLRRRCTPSTETARHRARRCRTRGRRSGATPAAPFALPRAIDPPPGVGKGAGKELQRDRGAQLEIVRAVDDAHAAATEQADHPVAATEHGAGREGSAEGVNVRDDSGSGRSLAGNRGASLVRRSSERLPLREARLQRHTTRRSGAQRERPRNRPGSASVFESGGRRGLSPQRQTRLSGAHFVLGERREKQLRL